MGNYSDLIKNIMIGSKNLNHRFLIACVSNMTLEPYFTPSLRQVFYEEEMELDIIYVSLEDYSNVDFSMFDMIIIWIEYRYIFPHLVYWINDGDVFFSSTANDIINFSNIMVKKINNTATCSILWIGLDEYDIKKIYLYGHIYHTKKLFSYVNDIIAQNDEMLTINLNSIIALIGIHSAYDYKNNYRFGCPYSLDLVKNMAEEILKQFKIIHGQTKKCLILDCDDVLWGGILSEDGIENIKLNNNGVGRAYQDFQRFLLSLYYHGVILAICSKNDMSDVKTMFHEHNEMILKEEHIACFQVNWNNKPDNIKRIAETLNISLDSIVFVDDSLIEIEAVKAMLPEVTAIIYEHNSVYKQLSCFNLKNNENIADIKKRNETYRTNQSRKTLKSQYSNYNDYLNALEIKVDIHEAIPIEFNRISELTHRTNQCTNGKRYTVTEIKERYNNDNITLYSLSVSDRFSDLGLVGALEVADDTLTLFSLSCRALGREIEEKMLAFVVGKHKINQVEFHSTGKNNEIIVLLIKAFPNAKINY